MIPLYLTEEELRELTDMSLGAVQSNGPLGYRTPTILEIYRKAADASAIAHRAVIEEGASSLIVYNPANETAHLRLELGDVEADASVSLKTVFTEAFETLLTIIVVGGLVDDDEPL